MAIYRTGTASLAANGVVIGVGTKWQDKLSLIRVGATIMFPTVVGAIGTISAIVSDTELRVMTTNGSVVPAGSQYVILLHDSITVDGLAQDVAETLRYYQGKETEIADALDFFRTFDWEQFKVMTEKVAADAAEADASKNAAAGSATAAANSATAAAGSATSAKASETAANASKLAAAASQVAAKTSETNAKTSEANANTSETNSLASKNAAAASQSAALASQNAAKTSETNAKTSETNSKTSETNAKASETAALASKNAAAASQTAAAGSATAALASQNASKTSENNAKSYADSINPSSLLAKSQNLNDVASKSNARENLELGRFRQISTGETQVRSGSGSKWLFVDNNGGWGCWDETIDGPKGLSLSFGGTGAVSLDDARVNLLIDRFNQSNANETQVISGNCYTYVNDSGGWGCYSKDRGARVALDVNAGGTGSLSEAGARLNLSAFYEKRVSLDSSVNLDTMGGESSGIYRNPSNSHATTENNYPTRQAGSLMITKTIGGEQSVQAVQKYHTYQSGRDFSRVRDENAWQNWKEYTMTAVSDERMKDIKGNLDVEAALDNVNRMEFKIFSFNNDGPEKSARRGVISQQLRLIDKEYTKEIGGYYHLDQTPMLLDGLAAIKALRERDEDNKVRIEKLESDIKELKAMVLALSSK